MSEGLKRYLKMQVTMNRLTREQVIAKYPEMEEELNKED